MSTQPEVSIVVDRAEISNWLSYEIDGNLLTPADAFSMRVGRPRPEHVREISEGSHCSVYVNGKQILKGVIDEVELEYSKRSAQSALTITGRDMAAYLVDCSAPLDGYEKITLKELARKICAPWSIPVRAAEKANWEIVVESNDPYGFGTLPRTQPEPGETCWEFLARYVKDQSLMMWMAPDGALVVSTPRDTALPELSLMHFLKKPRSLQNNIMAGRIIRSTAERYSHVAMKAQTQGDDNLFGSDASQIEATAIDEELVAAGILRPLILADYEISSLEQARRRAVQEVRLRRAKGMKAVYTVRGHSPEDAGAEPFRYDRTVEVRDELAGLNGVFYIVGRRFCMDRRNGATTVFTLTEKGALSA